MSEDNKVLICIIVFFAFAATLFVFVVGSINQSLKDSRQESEKEYVECRDSDGEWIDRGFFGKDFCYNKEQQ